MTLGLSWLVSTSLEYRVVAPLQKTHSARYNSAADKLPTQSQARVHRRRKDIPSSLVWVRKDIFVSGEFSDRYYYPIGFSHHLPIPMQFSFSRDCWARRTWKIPFVVVVKGMVGGGRDQSSCGGGRYAAGSGG